MQQIKSWFIGLDEKEQKITLGFAGLLIAMLVFLLVIDPINNSVASLEIKLTSSQKSNDWMKQQIPLIRSKAGVSGTSTSSMSLSSLVNNTTKKYGLPVSRRDSKSPNEMQVWFDNVSFDSFLTWVAEIKSRHGVTITSVNIRSREQDGITSINVKLLK